MSNLSNQDNEPLQEWSPLTSLLDKIPATFQIGLFTRNINFTCIDVISEFIAIGTNHGVVYWFNRKTEEIEAFECQNTNSIVTCIQVISTVDYMVAAGNNHGVVTIFQVPKQPPDTLPEPWKLKKKKQVERFNISDLHKVSITSVEWSKNGMKLFSGDKNGLVVLTQMDFYMHLSKSTEFLNEKYSVVQLSYQNGLLLISTLFRTIIADINNNNKIIQVGQKERKMLGKFGAVFSKNNYRVHEPVIYASRPGLRIWRADKNGSVLKTLILEESVDQIQVRLLNPAPDNTRKKSQGNPTFGIIIPFSDYLLVTYNDDVIYFIDPNSNLITSIVKDLRKITDIACCGDEIFILEGERNILRIACYPEEKCFNAAKDQFTDQLTSTAELNNPITLGLENLKMKLKLTPIIPAIPFDKLSSTFAHQPKRSPSVAIGIDITSIINADEAVEMPANMLIKSESLVRTDINTLSNEIDSCVENNRCSFDRKDIFRKIGEQDFEEIVFTPERKNNRLKNAATDGQLSQADTIITDRIEIKNHEREIVSGSVESIHSSKLSQSIAADSIFKSESNLENIRKSIRDKEKILFNYLNLDLSTCMNRRSNSCSSTDVNNYSSDLTNYYTKDQNCIAREQDSTEQKTDNYITKLIAFEDCEYNTKYVDTKKNCNHKSDLNNRKISEIQFNELSKDFVKSVIYQENDDWILLG